MVMTMKAMVVLKLASIYFVSGAILVAGPFWQPMALMMMVMMMLMMMMNKMVVVLKLASANKI